MDLLCTENIRNDYDNENTQHQIQRKQQYKPQLTPNSFSSSSSSSSLGSSSAPSSSSSSGYNSVRSNSSNCSNSSSNTIQCTSTCTLVSQNATKHAQPSSLLPSESMSCHQDTMPQHSTVVFHEASDVSSTHINSSDGGIQVEKHQHISYSYQQQYQQQRQQQQEQPPHMNAYTKNLLNRTLDVVNTATRDPIFLTDRCLENALKAEEKRPNVDCSYFKKVQKDITPPMRKIVAEWMMEVCAEEKCQEEVVLLALNYMDRFLSTKSVRKIHLQILAAACLLLASKLREPCCRALSAELLVFYTDNSICKSDLIKWELFVLSRLGWDLSSVTPLDFLELLLIRLPIKSAKCPDLNIDKVRQHAQAFVSLAAKEHQFSTYSASSIAASSIAAALSGLNWHLRTGQNLRHLLNLLTDLTSVEQDSLHGCMMKMESIFEEHSRNLQPYLASVDPQQQQLQLQHQQQQHHHHQHKHHNPTSHHSSSRSGGSSGNTNNTNVMLPDLTQTCKMQANAHKDMQDIKF